MKVKDCVFCQIIKGEIPSTKIWENKNFLAVLDIQPIVKGMTVIFPKEHYSSKVFEMNPKIYKNFMQAGYEVAQKLKAGLGAKRVFMVIEGLDVNHAHLKLYPINREQPLGVILTRKSRKKTPEELNRVAEKIRG